MHSDNVTSEPKVEIRMVLDTTDALLAAYRADPSEASGRALHAHLVDTRWHLFLFEERAWTAWQGPWSAWVPAPYDGWSRIDRWRR